MMSMLRQVLTMSAVVAGGMAVGAGLGILFAPHSGRVTREQIQVHVHKAQDEVTQMGGRVKQKVRCEKKATPITGEANWSGGVLSCIARPSFLCALRDWTFPRVRPRYSRQGKCYACWITVSIKKAVPR